MAFLHGLAVVVAVCLVQSAHGVWYWSGASTINPPSAPLNETCLELARQGSCEFYKCFTKRYPCIQKNYALLYGYEFCARFKMNFDKFTPVAQRWITGTRECATRGMVDQYKSKALDCHRFFHQAEKIHATCSLSNGGCSLRMIWSNRKALKDTVKSGHKLRLLNRLSEVVKECGGSYFKRAVNYLLRKMGMGQIHG